MSPYIACSLKDWPQEIKKSTCIHINTKLYYLINNVLPTALTFNYPVVDPAGLPVVLSNNLLVEPN